MPTWNIDPYKLKEHHQTIARRIQADEPGLAQSVIGNSLVSYDATDWPATFSGSMPLGREHFPNGASGNSVIEEMLLDIAHGDGIASRGTFSRSQVAWLIEDRRRWPRNYTKKHREADHLERLLLTRPQIFY